MCSTPFGINERGTPPNASPVMLAKCAQRLSASTNEEQSTGTTPPMRRRGAQRLSASTNEERDRIGRDAAPTWVLNAFRHQRTRNNRPLSTFSAPWECAQRLSASTNEELLIQHTIEVLPDLCSTPFGINERGTSGARPESDRGRRVLNAFRHQRTRNRSAAGSRSLGWRVLNAFRHQRTRNGSRRG